MAVILMCLVCYGPTRAGSLQPNSTPHSHVTAAITNLVMACLFIVASVDLVRGLRRGGAIVRGRLTTATVQVIFGSRQSLGNVRLGPRDGVAVHISCRGASEQIIKLGAYLFVDRGTTMDETNMCAEAMGDLAWEAEKEWSGILVQNDHGARSALCHLAVCVLNDSPGHADLTVRWRTTIVARNRRRYARPGRS